MEMQFSYNHRVIGKELYTLIFRSHHSSEAAIVLVAERQSTPMQFTNSYNHLYFCRTASQWFLGCYFIQLCPELKLNHWMNWCHSCLMKHFSLRWPSAITSSLAMMKIRFFRRVHKVFFLVPAWRRVGVDEGMLSPICDDKWPTIMR